MQRHRFLRAACLLASLLCLHPSWAAEGSLRSSGAAPRPPEGRVSGGVFLAGVPDGVPFTGAAEMRPLVLGVFPNLTAQQVIETYRPVAGALEKSLQRRVTIYTARDFTTFVARTHSGEYDLVLTAPHLAWLARQDAGYRPLLKYAEPVRGIAVVKSDSTLASVADLRRRTLAIGDPLALVVLAMQDQLAAQGLKPGRDYRLLDAGSHANTVMKVVMGDADAAILGLQPFLLQPDPVRSQLRILAETPPLSSQMFLAHPRLGDAEAEKVRRALLTFADSPAGREFMQKGGFGGLAAVAGDELHAFRPYALKTRALLKAAP